MAQVIDIGTKREIALQTITEEASNATDGIVVMECPKCKNTTFNFLVHRKGGGDEVVGIKCLNTGCENTIWMMDNLP